MATLYDVSTAQAQTPEVAKERADGLSRQFIMDCHTHFLRDDTRIMTFVRQRQAVGKAGWNQALAGKEQTLEDLKFPTATPRWPSSPAPRRTSRKTGSSPTR